MALVFLMVLPGTASAENASDNGTIDVLVIHSIEGTRVVNDAPTGSSRTTLT